MKKTALITGASSGIGEALSWVYAREGYDLVIIARRKERLESLAAAISEKYQQKVTLFAQDLTVSDAVDAVCSFLSEQEIVVDVLVNNVGISVYGALWQIAEKDAREVLVANIDLPVQLTRRLLPGMVERGYGSVVGIASIAAFVPSPKITLYYASKAFLLSFFEGLSESLRGTGVTATVICPGPTESEFKERGRTVAAPLVVKYVRHTSEEIAEYTYKKASQGKRVGVPGIVNKAIVFGSRIIPHAFISFLVGRNQ